MIVWLPIISVIAVGVTILIIIAFRQGRSVNLWHLQIGPKPRSEESTNSAPITPPPSSRAESAPVRDAVFRSHAPSPPATPTADVNWAALPLRSDSVVTLQLLSQTDHSTIHTCQIAAIPDETFVVKRTSAELCDFEALTRLVAEAAKCRIPAVAAPSAVWREGPYVFELQKLVSGPTLGRVVVCGHKSVARGAMLREFLSSMTAVLNWLREIDLVHCDVTPFNIVVSDYELKLVDWSFCRRSGHKHKPVGTIGFTAPEQHRGRPTNESDWYGLAKSLVFLAAGDGEIPADSTNHLDLSRLLIESDPGFRLFYQLSDGRRIRGGDEIELLRELLARRATIRRIVREPISGPLLYSKDAVSGFAVLEVDTNLHLVISDRRWYLLPEDLPSLMSDLANVLSLPSAKPAEAEIVTALNASNRELAGAISAYAG